MGWTRQLEVDKVTAVVLGTIHDDVFTGIADALKGTTPELSGRIQLALTRAFILGRHREVDSRMNAKEIQLKQARKRCNRLLEELEDLKKEAQGGTNPKPA